VETGKKPYTLLWYLVEERTKKNLFKKKERNYAEGNKSSYKKNLRKKEDSE
jgi:hypothetical protein